ncbi:MAG: DUF255 domain-containing protein [Saprospiraceae bacterium]|nr:DUF255 domain-containing protein [Saprospiraceae bacterium]
MKTQISVIKMVLFGFLLLQGIMAQANSFSLDHYEEAKKAASVENKLLMLKFTASWCLPCKFMQKNVFEDYSFTNYLNERVIEVEVDVDKFAGMDLKEIFNVKSLPTIIILNPDAIEVSRKNSSLGISDMKSWLESLVSKYNITVASSKTKILPSNSATMNEVPTSAPSSNGTEVSTINTPENNIDSEATENLQIQSSSVNEDQFNSLFGSYYVQTGVYSEFENAMQKASELDELFSQNSSIFEEEKNDGNKIYKINLGPFDSEEEAAIFVEVLKDRNLDAFIKKAEF